MLATGDLVKKHFSGQVLIAKDLMEFERIRSSPLTFHNMRPHLRAGAVVAAHSAAVATLGHGRGHP